MNQRLELSSSRVDQTMAIGAIVARHCRVGDVVALIGDLGSGKTQFVRGMAIGLGIDPALVTSPTFVMVQEYPGNPTLVHIDAYRFSGPSDLDSIGWSSSNNELRQGAIVAVEWADQVLSALGGDRLDVRIAHTEAGRFLALAPRGDWQPRTSTLFQALEALRSSHGSGCSTDLGKQANRTCPTCGKPATSGQDYFPFCSQRCQTIDLGRWLDGRYVISRPIEQSDLDEGE